MKRSHRVAIAVMLSVPLVAETVVAIIHLPLSHLGHVVHLTHCLMLTAATLGIVEYAQNE